MKCECDDTYENEKSASVHKTKVHAKTTGMTETNRYIQQYRTCVVVSWNSNVNDEGRVYCDVVWCMFAIVHS